MIEMKIRLVARFSIGLLLCVSSYGCGGGESAGPPMNATVSGVVTHGGQPVSNATISFEKPGLGAWGTKLADDGTYSVELSAGEFVITVVPIAPAMSMNDSGTISAPPDRDDIPEEYRSASTTKGKAVIEAGSNTVDLELK